MNRIQEIINSIKLFVLDLDGTVYLGERLIPGALEFVENARRAGKRVLFFSNNASKVATVYVEKLTGLGFDVTGEDIITSGDVTIDYLKTCYPGKKVLLNGTPLLKESFEKSGITLVEDSPDVCVQSFDTTLTYEKLRNIANHIRSGVPFIATHCDINCPTETGFIPDCGAICSLLTASTGKIPKYLGKPNKETVDMIVKRTGNKLEEIAFVGDRIYTDVATGINNGAFGFLVLSGESDQNTVNESAVKPDLIFDSVKDIIPYLT